LKALPRNVRLYWIHHTLLLISYSYSFFNTSLSITNEVTDSTQEYLTSQMSDIAFEPDLRRLLLSIAHLCDLIFQKNCSLTNP
jgi:hypothetical protein